MCALSAHPKARPETPEPPPAPATGIAYLDLVAAAHHAQVAADEKIGFHALYSTTTGPTAAPGAAVPEQIPGQLSIEGLTDDPRDGQAQEAGR